MFRSLISILIFSLPFSVFARAPGTYAQLKTDLQTVSQKQVIGWVNELIRVSAPSRMVGMPGHERAKMYLVEEIKKLDLKNTGSITLSSAPADVESIKKFYQDDFDKKIVGKLPPTHPDYQKWFKFTKYMQSLAEENKASPVDNIIWEKNGINSKKQLVITAHYDTISHDKNTFLVNSKEPMPGANYNASGVAVALGLIKTLAGIDLNYSVKVVLLDWQGIGFHGSYQFAKELKKSGKEIMGVINLEMLGQDTSFFDKTKKNGNMSVYSRDLANELRWLKSLNDHGSKITSKVSFEVKPNGFDNFDNFRFWDEDFLSVTFSQNWEDDFNPKFYQTSQDTTETLNHETLWHAYQYVGGAAIGILLDLTK